MFKNKLNETKSRKAKLSTQTMAVFAILIAGPVCNFTISYISGVEYQKYVFHLFQ